MEYHCRGNCEKSFASISSTNKYERTKEHFNEKKSNHEINFDKESKLYLCPSTGCETTSKCRHNIVKHLKSCKVVTKRRKSAANKKMCQVCGEEFAKKSNRNRHFNLFHVENNSIEIEGADKSDLDNELPTIVTVMSDDQNVDNFVLLQNNEVDPTPNIEDSNFNEGEVSNEHGVGTENDSESHIDDATDPVLSEPATQRAAKGSRRESCG